MRIEYNPEENKTSQENEPDLADQLKETLKGDNIREEMKDQLFKMKDKPFKEKAEYFIRYYGLAVLGAVVVIGIITSILISVLSKKDVAFKAMIVNATGLTTVDINEDFAEYAGIDLTEYQVDIDTGSYLSTSGYSYDDTSTLTRYLAEIQSRDLDCAIFHSERFALDSSNMLYADLNEVLSKEDIERFKDNFYYIDYKEYERLQSSDDPGSAIPSSEPTEEEINESLEYHTHPENMEEPIAVGIILTDCPYIQKTGCYPYLTPVFGIVINTQRLDTAINFLHYLYEIQ